MKKKSNRKNSAIRTAIFLVALAIVVSGVTRIAYFIYEEASIYDIKEFDATFEIGNSAGLAGDTDKLNFGKVPPGGNSRREILLYHEYEKPLKIKIIYIGTIKEVLLPIEPFYLNPNEEQRIGLIAYANRNSPEKFSGVVRIMYIK